MMRRAPIIIISGGPIAPPSLPDGRTEDGAAHAPLSSGQTNFEDEGEAHVAAAHDGLAQLGLCMLFATLAAWFFLERLGYLS